MLLQASEQLLVGRGFHRLDLKNFSRLPKLYNLLSDFQINEGTEHICGPYLLLDPWYRFSKEYL